MGKLALAGRAAIALAGLLTLGCGVIHIVIIVTDSENWCPGSSLPPNYDTNTIECIGPSLAWSTAGNTDSVRSNLNQDWRLMMFSLQPSIVVDIWTPTVLGIFTLAGFFTKGLRINTIAQSWLAATLWLIVCMLWGQFAYAGNFGIVSGFITSVICCITLACHFLEPDEAPSKDFSGYVGY
eukprot:TRINITY_DN3188_c0_g1_i1.p1 TRINITY_DN3188_c0_g1~~TRINITY_DN3188_c0_g1_i1.p1  ORF type:complete len:194 (+),score=37.28 TRINITY_DN3188_c0_g1_i1:42-584(+)